MTAPVSWLEGLGSRNILNYGLMLNQPIHYFSLNLAQRMMRAIPATDTTENPMSKTANIALARRLYDSGAAPEVTREVMAADLVWDISPGFPHGGVYHGYESTMKDFFGQVMPLFASWSSEAKEYYGDDDNHVFVVGEYHGVTKDGKKADVRFIHLWTVRDGKLAALKQAADSHIVQHALGN